MTETEMGVTPQAETTEATATEATPSTLDQLIGTGESDQTATPAEETDASETSTTDENKTEGVSSDTGVEDVKSKTPETVPYEAMKEKVDANNELKSKLEELESKFTDPDKVREQYETLIRSEKPGEQEKQPITLQEIDKQIAKVTANQYDYEDVQQYEDVLYALNQQKTEMLLSTVHTSLEQKEMEHRQIEEMAPIVEKVFQGNEERKTKVFEYIDEWTKANPDAKFPFTGEKGWRSLDVYVNGENTNAYKQGQNAAEEAITGKRILDMPKTQSPNISTGGNSTIDRILAM